MRVAVVTPPDPLVSWEEADAHLRLEGNTSEKTYVEALIAAASAHIDGPSGWLGRAIGIQTLEAWADGFGGDDGLRLPCPPAIGIDSVIYLDTAGGEQTLDAMSYELRGDVLVPVWGASWPSIGGRAEAVRVRYRAGYVTDVDVDPLVAAVPAPIKAAVLLMVGDLYANRETAGYGTQSAMPMSVTVQSLLAPYRVWA